MLKEHIKVADTSIARVPPKHRDPFYITPEYLAWRDIVINRAGRVCEWPGCGRREIRMFADHIVEISDGGAMLDPGNGQCLCGKHHTIKTNEAKEARQYAFRGASAPHPAGLHPSRIPLTIVCGAPASGKSRYVAERAAEGDLIIDLDVIASRLARSSLHSWPRTLLTAALAQRNRLLRRLSDPSARWPAAWFIVAEPKAEQRQWWRETLKPRAIVVLETTVRVCHLRIAEDPERQARRAEISEAAAQWWNDYERHPGDVVVKFTN